MSTPPCHAVYGRKYEVVYKIGEDTAKRVEASRCFFQPGGTPMKDSTWYCAGKEKKFTQRKTSNARADASVAKHHRSSRLPSCIQVWYSSEKYWSWRYHTSCRMIGTPAGSPMTLRISRRPIRSAPKRCAIKRSQQRDERRVLPVVSRPANIGPATNEAQSLGTIGKNASTATSTPARNSTARPTSRPLPSRASARTA